MSNPDRLCKRRRWCTQAYVRLVESAGLTRWNSRGHFFGAAAEAMRRILIDNARRKQTEKHGGGYRRLELSEVDLVSPDTLDRWLLLDDAIERLTRDDAAAAGVAKLRLFAGLSVEDAAQALGISRATAFRHWTYARAWLQAELHDGEG